MLGGFWRAISVKTILIGLQRVMDCAVVLQFIREVAPG